MKQQLIEAGKVIIFGFISGNMIIGGIAATMFIWGYKKELCATFCNRESSQFCQKLPT